MPPTSGILCLSLCLYGIGELASATYDSRTSSAPVSSRQLQSYLADSIILAVSVSQGLEVVLISTVAVGAPEVPGAVTVG